ncbi:MAG: glycine cleavage system protein GcvH [Candidatus Margulisbacteria bacterium]|nr:glycine cleavage system protein GcvH [Candidatus Margulisiibacteriota bacterium]
MIPKDLRYTEEHEWIKVENGEATIGITEHASQELGEIVFAELPEVGTQFDKMAEFGSVESVKTVSSLYLPVSGEISAINEDISEQPETINNAPYSEGWLVRVKLSDEKEVEDLMTQEQYESFLEKIV